MRLPKKITRIMACMLSGAIAAGPAFSAQSVYRVYVPGLQPTSAPVSASSLITATPSSAQLSAEVGSSSYADISLTASAPSALSFDTASLPPSIQLVSNTCSSSNSTQACAVRVLYSPLTPESATYPLKWTSETQSGQIMLELAATPAFQPTSSQSIPHAIALLNYAHTLPGQGTWALSSNLPPSFTFVNNTLQGTPTSSGTYPLELTYSFNGTTTTHSTTLNVLEARADLSNPPDLHTTLGQPLIAQPINFVNKGSAPLLTSTAFSLAAPDITVSTSACPSLLQPAQSCSVLISYTPLSLATGVSTLTAQLLTPSNSAIKASNPLVIVNNQEAHSAGVATLAVPYSASSAYRFTTSPLAATVVVNEPLNIPLASYLSTAAQGTTWTPSPALPPGLSLNPATGVLSGTSSQLLSPWTGSVAVTSPDGNAASVPLTLQWQQHSVVVSTSQLDFGAVDPQQPKSLAYLVHNNGHFSETIGTPVLYGATSASTLTTNCPSSLLPNQSCLVQVTFAPEDSNDSLSNAYVKFETSNTASLSLFSAAHASTTSAVPTVRVSAYATASTTVSVPPQELIINEPTSINLAAYFSGVISGTATWALDSTPQGLSLNPVTGVLAGTPTLAPSSGSSTHTLTVSYRSSPLMPLQRLTSTVTFNAKDYSWTLSKPALAFDQSTFEGQSAHGWLNHAHDDSVIITNTGNQPLTISSATLSPSDHTLLSTFAKLSPANGCSTTVAPGSSCTLQLTYTPSSEHDPISLPFTIATDRASKSVSLNLTAYNPLNLSTPAFDVYRGSYSKIDLSPLLTLGTALQPPLNSADVLWTTPSPQLPAGLTLDQSTHTIKGLVLPSATSTTTTLTASYAYNTQTTPATFTVRDAVITVPSDSAASVWQTVPYTHTLTLTAPASNTHALVISPQTPLASTSHPDLNATASNNCASLAPGASCTLSVQLQAGPAPSILGAQSLVLNLTSQYNGQTLTTPIPLAIDVKNPLQLNTPSSLNLLTSHTIATVNYSSLASYLPATSTAPNLFTWALTNLPPGLAFNPATQQLSGTPSQAGTFTSELQVSYKGLTVSKPLTIQVADPLIETSAPSLDMGAIYLGTTATRSIAFTLPNGGTITSIPSPTLSATYASSSTTCSTGSKAPGYSCTLTLTAKPANVPPGPWASSATLATKGSSATIPLAMTIVNPLSLPDQEPWTLLSGQPHTLENFSALLTDARNAAATTTWAISATNASSATISSGTATLTAPQGSGTFTITATRNGASVSKTYSFTSIPWPWNYSTTPSTGFFGYKNNSAAVQTITNTSSRPISTAPQVPTITDLNTSDKITPSIAAQTCSSKTIAPNASCTLTIAAVSQDTTTPFSAQTALRFYWAPQPQTKPTRTITFTQTSPSGSLPVAHPLSWAAVPPVLLAQNASFTAPLASFLTNSANSAQTYAWSAQNLPPGVSINSATGLLSGSTSVSPGTYTATVSVSYSSPYGLTLSATTPVTFNVVQLAVSATPLDFGLLYPESGLQSRPVTLTNTGTVPVTVQSLAFPSSAQGRLTADTSTCPTLALGASCSITVSLTPGSMGVLASTGVATLSYSSVQAQSVVSAQAVIASPLLLTPSLPVAYDKTPYTTNLSPTLSHFFKGTNPQPSSWSSAALPAGWTLSSSGVLTGTPSISAVPSFPITAQHDGYSVSATYPLVVQPLTLSATAPLNFGLVYSSTGPKTLEIPITNTSSTALAHLSVSLNTPSPDLSASLIGCSNLSPTTSCTLRVAYNPLAPLDSYSNAVTLSYGVAAPTHTLSLPITATVQNPLSLTPAAPLAIKGLPYSYNLQSALTSAVEAAPSSPAWTLSGSLPAGLTFNSTTGVLSGIPSTFEHKTLTLSATYKGNTITAPLSLATGEHKLVLSPSTIAPPALLQGSPSSSYPVTITNASTRADTLEPIGVSFYQGVPGLQLSAGHPHVAINNTNCATLLAPGTSCTAIISVNPTVLGSFNLAATTSAGSTTLETHKATATLSFSVINPLSLEPTTPPAGLVNAPYSLALGPLFSNSLSPAPAPSWSAQNLPKGLTLNASSGTISGTPLEDGDFSVIVSVTAGLSTISQTYPLRIVAVGVTATPNPLSYGTVATNWEQPSRTVTLSNPTSWPQALTLSLPTLPYLTLDTSSTCTTSLAPNSSCTLNLTYAPTTVAHDLAHNLTITASSSGFSRTTTVRITGTAVNPLRLVDGLPPAFVGIPFKHPLQNNLRPSPSDGLDLTGISWANSNPIINPLTGELSVTPLNTNPIKATAKVALRGNTASFAYIINPLQTTFSLTPNPASYDFGSLYANNGEATAAITLTNTGTHSAEITGQPSFSSNTSAHPFVIKTSTCGTEVAPGASCLLTVGYTPTSPAASIASTLRIPVGKYGFTTTTTSVPLTARVLNPLLFASTLVQPIVGIPHTQDFNPSITSLIDTVDTSQISWNVSSGSLPAGLSFNNGLITGIATDTNSTSATLSATYKGNTITRTFAFAPRVISASVSPSTVDLGLLYPGQVKTQNFSVVNTSSNQALTIETPPSSQTLPAGATLSTNCTQGRSLNPGAGCTVAIRYAPTAAAAPWSASFQLGVGRNGVSVQTLTATLTGAAPTAMTFAAVPNQQLSKGFPYSLNMRNYLTVAVNPSVSNTSITWTTSGTLPAGLTFSNGVISGKATTLTSASFQITASYAGSSATSNPFTLEVVEPVVFVPPPSEPSFYASALSPASQGAIFVDQSKTFATEWRVNAPATITATPYVTPGAVNAMQVVWHNCAAVGTQVPAGYTCQAIVQFSGTTSNIGNRSGLVRMTVGTGAIAYAQANAYFTGSVLNPLVIYPQEQIWGLAANTPLVPVSDVFVDRFPNGTPVTVTLTPDFDYRSYPSPSYASSTAPAYLANGYITQGPLAESRGIYKHTLTVTKHTSPPLTLSTPIEVRIRRHSEFSSVVAAVNGLWEGYPDNVIRYNLTNTHNIPITPVAEAGGWTEVDFNTSDSITSSAATDCLRPLPTGASCSYTRAVNPGNAGPNEQAIFGMRTTFRYAPQPTTKPSQTVLATHPITLPSSPGTPGGAPTHNAKGMSSRSTVGQSLVYQDLGPYQDPLNVAGPFYLVADASGCNDGLGAWTACMTGPYAYQTRMMRMPDHMAYPYVRTSRGGFRIFNAKTNDYNPPAPSVQVSVVSGQIALDGVSSQHVLDKAWQFSWSNGQLTANLEHHSKWPITRWNVTVPDSMLAKGHPSLNVALSGQFPSGKRYSYSKQGLVFHDSPLYRSDYATATQFLPGAPYLGQRCSAYSSFSFLNAGAPRHGYCSY